MDEENQSEITLGVGKLLMLFFGLVVLCGIFMGIGYTMGRNSVKIETAANGQSPVPIGTPVTGAAKPGAGQNTAAHLDCAAGQDCPPKTDDLGFYKAVEQKEADAQLTPPTEKPAASAPATPAPEMKNGPGTGFVVQIAAVTKREDAEALTDALRRKQYPVIITNVPTDKLFHVQLGPFADVKEAEAMKVKLVSDGYNPIVKK